MQYILTTYHYDCQLSQGAKGARTSASSASVVLGGELQAASVAEARDIVLRLVPTPGIYVLRMRRGHRWLKTRAYDVRSLGKKGNLYAQSVEVPQ